MADGRADGRLWRSALYVPASNARALAKAGALPADALILDLEDAVAPEAKALARAALAGAPRGRARLVRVNGAGTPWHEADLLAAAAIAPDGIVLPKVAGPAEVEAARARLGPGAPPLWAMIETPAGVLAAAAVAPRVAGLIAGTNDLAEDLRARPGAGRGPLLAALSMVVLAARAAGIVALDGVCVDLAGGEAFAAECRQGRDWGFDGKTLIHPAQIAAANAAFAPSPEEVDLARRRVEAFEAARAEGRGVAVLDGRLVEGLHVAAARAMLARAEAVREAG